MALVHNPAEPDSPAFIATGVEAVMANLSADKALKLLALLLELDSPVDHTAMLSLATESGVSESRMEKLLSDTSAVSKVIQNHAHFSVQVLKLQPGETALLSNGKVCVHWDFPCSTY